MYTVRPFVVVAVSALLFAGLVFGENRPISLTAAAPRHKAPDSDEIHELLAERVEILKQRMDIAVNDGMLEADEVDEARRDYLNARLDMSTNVAERIAVLKEIVDEAERAHKAAAQAHGALLIGKTEELKVKAYVLEARVALARAELER